MSEALDRIITLFADKGDLGHAALLLWALGSAALIARLMRDLGAANSRFDSFVRELARFNSRQGEDD